MDQHGPLEGAAAQREEIVLDADPVQPEDLPQPRRPANAPARRRGARYSWASSGRADPGAGRLRRSILPLEVRGRVSRATKTSGIVYPGSFPSRKERSPRTLARAPAGLRRRRPGGGLPARPRGPARRRPPRRGWLPAPPRSRPARCGSRGLHLMIEPAQVLQDPVGQPAAQVARPVQPRSGSTAERIGHERSAVSSGRLR